MLRLSRLLLVLGSIGVPVGLHVAHGSLVTPAYDALATGRWLWSGLSGALVAVLAFALGLPDLPAGRRAAVAAAISASAAALAVVSTGQLVLGSPLLPRFVVAVSPGMWWPLALLCWNLAADGRERRAERDRVLLVAAPDSAAALRADLARDAERSSSLVAHLTPDEGELPGRIVVESAAARATVLVLDTPAQAVEHIVEQAALLHARGVRVRTLSLFYEEWLGKLPVADLQRASLLFDVGEVHRALYGRTKRLLDVALAAVGLPLLVALVPVVAAGNRLGNRGPLLFRQERVGRHGRTFSIWKFRTMVPDGSVTGPSPWTGCDDARVTPFGRWLRRSHLDELPQLVNVLRGDLSIVGPRPEQVAHVEELVEKIPFFDVRHLVRPGLTGWAQVKYGYAASTGDSLEKLQYDMYYLRRQGLGLDLSILVRTLRSVLRRDGR